MGFATQRRSYDSASPAATNDQDLLKCYDKGARVFLKRGDSMSSLPGSVS